jgi:hypothetical protein
MRSSSSICLLVFLATVGALTSCSTAPLNKQEAAEWYNKYHSMVRWVGYQGSDQRFHYFIARVMDEWSFIQIGRGELDVADERPFSRASNGPLYYYLVDPSQNYRKVLPNDQREPDAAANQSQPVTSGKDSTSAAAGSGR